jgi:AcrR family transcriptional regulator
MTTATTPRSAKGQRTRARLLEAGKVVFERDGFLDARITDIAAEANVSHGSFYHYFDSKEAIFREIAEQVEVRLVSMDDMTKEGERPKHPVERIRLANRSYLNAYRREAKIMRVIEEVSRYDDAVREVRVRRDDSLSTRLEASIARLQAAGVADPAIDGHYAATALGGMVARFAEQMFLGGGAYTMDGAVEQLTILWSNALGIESEAAPTKRTTGRRTAASTAK